MRLRSVFAAGVWGAGLLAASAQVELNLQVPYTSFLEMEPAEVVLTIFNQSGAPIRLGGTNATARIYLDIEGPPGQLVAATGEPVVETETVIPPRGRHTLNLDMVQLYRLRKSGPFSVNARLTLDGNPHISDRYLFDILPGFELRRMVAALPEEKGDRRKFTIFLKSMARDRQEWLFLRVDEESAGICHGVYNLGPLIRLMEPQVEVGADNRIHVFHQSAPTRFTYCVFELDGRPVSSTYYTAPQVSAARLVVSEDGDVSVVGVRPYQGDPSLAPLRASTREWKPAATPPNRNREPAVRGRTPHAPAAAETPAKTK